MSNVLFAVTREDFRTEENLISPTGSMLCIASGGCTPLSLKSKYPEMNITAFDSNPLQLHHIEAKIKAVQHGRLSQLNVENSDPSSLNQCGEFEGLFRIMKTTWIEFLCSEQELQRYFSGTLTVQAHQELVGTWMKNKYWMAPFHNSCNDLFLHMMFTDHATQHAGPNSYALYFSNQISRGLLRADGPKNPFLQHILLGYYKQKDAPNYVFSKRKLPLTLIEGTLTDIDNIEEFQLVSLSNALDWSDIELGRSWANHLKKLKAGAIVLIRQLNNTQAWTPFFKEHFDVINGSAAQQNERSLFYNQIQIFKRNQQ